MRGFNEIKRKEETLTCKIHKQNDYETIIKLYGKKTNEQLQAINRFKEPPFYLRKKEDNGR